MLPFPGKGDDMRYRILAPSYINGSFRILSTMFVDEKTGEERDIPWKGFDEVFSVQVETGTIVELDDKTKPAPWMEPLDDEARAQCEKWPDSYHPSELATIDSLALHGEKLQDRQSWANETAQPSKAPIYPPKVQRSIGASQPPKLPSLGGQKPVAQR